jgi:hypothetical protein
VSASGSFDKTAAWLRKIEKLDVGKILESQAQKGVRALSSATPMDSGLAANSWGYQIERSSNSAKITWTNSDVETGYPVAVMIQYGHGTGTGGFVQGVDYINPAMRPIFDEIANTVWKAVTSA